MSPKTPVSLQVSSGFDRIQVFLKKRGLDTLLITQPENRRYLSGFVAEEHGIEESAGVLLIPRRGRPFLLTDFRFQLDAESQAPAFEVIIYKKGLLSFLGNFLPRLGIRRLGFESHYVLHSTAQDLGRMANRLAIELVPLLGVVEKIRTRKSEEELIKIHEAVALNEEVFGEVFGSLRPGQTEKEVANRIESVMREKGADGPSFPSIVAAGPNAASPHAIPTARPINEGETVIIDMGVRLRGYCSDMTRTVVLGRPDDKTIELFRLVRRAQLAGQAAIRAGVKARDVDGAARRIIAASGYGNNFGHSLGHGVGLAVHEAPSLNRRNKKVLAPHMVVTVEPGVYIPGWGGIRLENMVVVEKDGCRLLNKDTTFLDL